MKDTLLLLPRFLLTMALCIIVVLGVMLLALSLDHAIVSFNKTLILAWILGNARAAFLFGLLFAVFSALFRLVHKPGIKPLSFTVLLLAAASSVFFGLFGLGLVDAAVREFSEPKSIQARQGIIEKSGSSYLWAGSRDGVLLRDIVTHGVGVEGFRVHPEAVYKPENRSIRLLDTGEEFRLSESATISPPAFLRSVFSDVSFLSNFLSPRSMIDWTAAVRVAVISAFLVSLWTLVRLTRWPLFNLLMALGALRAALFLVRFLGGEFLPEAAKIVKSEHFLSFLPVAVLGISGMVLFLICLLMKPLAEWKRDLEYD